MPEKRWTTPQEVVAYVVAHLIGIGFVYLETYLFMSRFYIYVRENYGTAAVPFVAIVQSLVIMVIVLFLFLALRVAISGGVRTD
jgi:hypothetical protein